MIWTKQQDALVSSGRILPDVAEFLIRRDEESRFLLNDRPDFFIEFTRESLVKNGGNLVTGLHDRALEKLRQLFVDFDVHALDGEIVT